MKKLKRWVHGKELQCGYTTGSCAAAAAKGAVQMLMEQKPVGFVTITTPGDILLDLELVDQKFSKTGAQCGVAKCSGDDPDITNGFKVYAAVEYNDGNGIEIDGGVGVGRVTKPGLSVAPGEAAINPVPRQMIERAVKEITRGRSGIKIVISIPEGVDAARKTFNPKLGIEGGISVLGTTGIVEPMSQEASKDSLVLELKAGLEVGRKEVTLVPGKYGENFAINSIGVAPESIFFTGNFIGELFAAAASMGVESVLLTGHIGKLVKVAGGIFNTYSRIADGRMEIMSSIASLMGGDSFLTKRILEANTTDEALDVIDEAGIKGFAEALAGRISSKLRDFSGLEVGVVLFSLQRGLIHMDYKAEEMIGRLKSV